MHTLAAVYLYKVISPQLFEHPRFPITATFEPKLLHKSKMKSYTLQIVSSLLGSAYAASHSIDVGEGGLVFSPNSTTAAVGDTVTFHFYPRAHGVARSSYSSPCAAIDNGFNSGFVQVASGESATTFTIIINNTGPIWYYCPQGDHCQAGMVGVINPP